MTRRLGVLLGAGASKEAGIPLTRELTERALAGVSMGVQPYLGRVLNFVVGQMIGHDSRNGAKPTELPGIERLVSALEMLSARERLEVAPFIDRWTEGLESIEVAPFKTGKSINGHKLAQALGLGGKEYNFKLADHLQVQLMLEEFVAEMLYEPVLDAFGTLLTRILMDLPEALEVKPGFNVDYLSALVARAHEEHAFIATLNYDLTVEKAGQQVGIGVDRGIDEWAGTAKLAWDERSVPLLKLHGSVDWIRHDDRPNEGRPPMTLDSFSVGTPTMPGELPFIVFGQREKLRPFGPFLQLLEDFRHRLLATDDLLVVGYAFADEHINAVLARWLETNRFSRIVVLDPSAEGWASIAGRLDGTHEFRQSLWGALDGRHSPDHIGPSERLALRPLPAGEEMETIGQIGLSKYIQDRFDIYSSSEPNTGLSL